MIAALTLAGLSILWWVLNNLPSSPDPDPDPDLAWVRALKHDADLDQAVAIGNSDEFRDWNREWAA